MHDVLWIAGMPRSGSSWLAQIFASSPETRLKLCPLFSYEFKNAVNERSTLGDWQDFLARVYETPSEYMDQDFLRKDGLVPHFARKSDRPGVLVIKSNRFHSLLPHLLRLGVAAKLLFVVRDPRTGIASWLSNPLEFPAGADPLVEWRSGRCRKTRPGEYWGFDDWKAVTRLHMQLARDHPASARILRYEDLVADPMASVAPVHRWLGLAVDEQTRAFIAESHRRHDPSPRSVYKDPDRTARARWQLPKEIEDAIVAELVGTDLQQFLAESRPGAPELGQTHA